MKDKTFLFGGIPGAGKGTQVALLKEYLKEKDPSKKHLGFSSGAVFRKFMEGSSFTSRLAKERQNAGNLQPEYLAVWVWASQFIEIMDGEGGHLFIDNFPRIHIESVMLDQALKFYKRTDPVFIFINLSQERAYERLQKRFVSEGRGDDSKESIETRFKLFDNMVMPAIKFFRDNSDYEFLEIDGSGDPEEVHANIIKELNL